MRPRDLPHHSQRPLGGPRALLKRSGVGLGGLALPSSPGILWRGFWEALGGHLGVFGWPVAVFSGLVSENVKL